MMSTTSAERRSLRLPALVVSLAAVAAVSVLGGLAAANAASDYGRLTQPDWAPPSGVFGPVWTVLYLLMAIAAWLVWRADPRWTNPAIIAYGAQLLLNLLWTPLFFGLGWRGTALVDIVVLDVLLAVTIALFWTRHRVAAALLVPYFAWSLFATALNLAVWSLNG
jgi:benzodiazapine receptor